MTLSTGQHSAFEHKFFRTAIAHPFCAIYLIFVCGSPSWCPPKIFFNFYLFNKYRTLSYELYKSAQIKIEMSWRWEGMSTREGGSSLVQHKAPIQHLHLLVQCTYLLMFLLNLPFLPLCFAFLLRRSALRLVWSFKFLSFNSLIVLRRSSFV